MGEGGTFWGNLELKGGEGSVQAQGLRQRDQVSITSLVNMKDNLQLVRECLTWPV